MNKEIEIDLIFTMFYEFYDNAEDLLLHFTEMILKYAALCQI